MYILTIKSGKVKTRIVLGCMEHGFDIMAYAGFLGTFHEFRSVPLNRLPKRDAEEKARAAKFCEHAAEWAAKFNTKVA